MIPTMLLAYDDAGRIIATLDYAVARNEAGEPIGLVDFAAHEAAGGQLTDIWTVRGAAGSGTWPEWLGAAAHGFRVEREEDGRPHRITALVHAGAPAWSDREGVVHPATESSGHRRERHAVEAAIAERIAAARGAPADIRDLVGGPERALLLDESGRTRERRPVVSPSLPIVRVPDSPSTPAADPRGADSLPRGRSQR